MKIINVAGKQLIVMGKGIKDLPLSPSKKNPGVMRHQGQALPPQTTEGGIPIVRGEGDSPAGRIHEDLKRAEERKKATVGGDNPGTLGKGIKLVIVLRKASQSKAQRRLMGACEHGVDWESCPKHMSKEKMHDFAVTKEKNLPEHVAHAQD